MEFHLADNRARLLISIVAAGIFLAIVFGALIAFTSPFIAFGIVIGAVAAAVVLSNIEFGMYAVIAVAVLLPFGALPVNLGFNPTFLDLALLALFGVWLARGMTRQGSEFIGTPLALPILVFLVLAIFSFVAGLAHASLEREVVRHFLEVLISIALFFVVANIVRTREALGRMVTALIVVGFIAAAIGIALYVLPRDTSIRLLSALRVFKYPTGDNVLRFIEDDPSGTLRAISTSIDPNVLGGLMILVTALTIPQVFSPALACGASVRGHLIRREIAAIMLGTMVVCLLLTFSRGALLGVVFALMVFLFAGLSTRMHPIPAAILTFVIAPLIALMGLFLLSLLPWTQTYAVHLMEGIQGQDRATQMRFGEYKDALNLISRYPFFGVGFGSSPDIDTYIGVSSVYLLMAEEMGLIGLSVFLLIMLLFFFHVMRAWFERIARDAFLAPILLGVTGALFGAMIGGVTDHYFFNLKFPHSVALFWLYAGLGMAAVRIGMQIDVDKERALP